MITKEQLIERIKALEIAKDQHLANANMCHGALTEAKHWLTELENDGNTDAAGDRTDGNGGTGT